MTRRKFRGFVWMAVALMALLMFGCGNSGNKTKGPELEPFIAGQFVIDLLGGDGAAGYGGWGGGAQLTLGNTSGYGGFLGGGGSGGDLKVLDNGIADASFTFPSSVTTYLGDTPLTVAAGETLTVEVVDEMPDVIGTPYLVNDNPGIYLATDNEEDFPDYDGRVTGISVGAGATLTLGLNMYSYTTAYINLNNDFHNAGTVTAAQLEDETGSGNLRLYPDNYHGEAGSSITLQGTAGATGTDGGNGGYLRVSCGFFYNQGAINTSGASGDNGGNGNGANINAGMKSYNTGNITATGGQGNAGEGGDGGYVSINSGLDNNNSGVLDASGGGGTSEGGGAGSVYIGLNMRMHGDLLNSGDLTANG
ncbi:MAG: hypothetical protein GY869_26375, partial [Planctomycetes bacterium]|nr:hypothetical protein [Planctomycetota bacterium]